MTELPIAPEWPPEDRDEWPVHQPEAFDAPIPGRQWYGGCDPDRPRVNPQIAVCESCGATACIICGRENCPDHSYFTWHGWEDECEPPEPGKEWITICENGEEIATIVHRTTEHPEDAEWKRQKVERARLIVSALNFASAFGIWR
jgi:hypothetical protein